MKQQSRLKSYVKRSGRLTNSQKKFLEKKEYDINFFNSNKMLSCQELFNNSNPCILDIGFGDGKLLTNIAKNFQNLNFIGIEVYDAGIGNILKQITENKLNNLKISSCDAIEFLENHITDKSLYGISLFYPDPWPKKKHHKRRIIDESFLNLVSKKINEGGFLKIATDWSNYADDIIELIGENYNFEKENDRYLFKNRILTKFEKRGILLGHRITELCYKVK